MPIAIDTAADGWEFCTLAAVGTSRSGVPFGVTAGHCGGEGDDVYGRVDQHVQSRIGTVFRSLSIGDGDLGLVALDDSVRFSRYVPFEGREPQPVVQVWSPETLSENVDGLSVCSQGATTGYRCGPLSAADERQVSVSAPSAPGDSGAGLFVEVEGGLALVGVHVASDGVGTPVAEQLKLWGLSMVASGV